MLSALSSYIWASEPDDQIVPDYTVQMRENHAENEWVLVDVVNPSTSDKSANACPVVNKPEGNRAVPHFGEVLEESWYITPPSCFNVSESDSSTLETSPLENLLIEHPSMSVYGVTEAGLEDSSSTAEQTPESSQSESAGSVQQRQHAHRRGLRVADKVELAKRRVQKDVLEHSKKTLRKKKLERHNMTQQHTGQSRRKQKQIDRKQGKNCGVYSKRGC